MQIRYRILWDNHEIMIQETQFKGDWRGKDTEIDSMRAIRVWFMRKRC
jgi:hypothetical protein